MDAHKKPKKPLLWPIVVALGCLLAWTALRRNDGSGLGVAYACAVGHPRRLDRVLTVLSCAIGRPRRCGRVATVLRVLGVLGVLGVLAVLGLANGRLGRP